MTDQPNKDEQADLPVLSARTRTGLSFMLVFIAIAHVFFPALAIDTTFLGLLALAAALLLFDLESFEWQGLKFRRVQRQIAAAEEKLEDVVVSAEPVPIPPPPAPLEIEAGQARDTSNAEAIEPSEVPELSPPEDARLRLLWAHEQIRIELLILAGNGGRLPGRKKWNDYRIRELADLLAKDNVIPSAIRETLDVVIRARNTFAHGHLVERLSNSGADLAMEVLAKLRSIPREYSRVLAYPLPVYRDRELSIPHESKAVMLARLGQDGAVLIRQVFPSTKEFHAGRFVSWEWSFETVSNNEAWYRTEDGTAQMAWSSAANFVGREFPVDWALEYRFPRPDAGMA